MPDALRGSLIAVDRLRHDEDRAEVEPSTVTVGGFVASHRVKVRPAVELMERRGALTHRQARAGRRLYRAHALGIAGAREGEKGCSAHTPHGYGDLQLGAAQAYREGRRAVGPQDWELVHAVCISDVTVSEYAAERLGSTSGRVIGSLMDRLRAGLDRLADYFRDADAEDDRRKA